MVNVKTAMSININLMMILNASQKLAVIEKNCYQQDIVMNVKNTLENQELEEHVIQRNVYKILLKTTLIN